MKLWRLTALAALCAALCACANTNSKLAVNAPIQWTSDGKRVVMIEPDVELDELTAGGILEPHADWTKAAKEFIAADVRETLSRRSVDLTLADTASDPRETQLVKLHAAVGNAILLHTVLLPLPNKHNALDWELGPGTNILRDHYKSDYALFIFVRDSYSSSGRKALMLFAAMAGIGVSGGVQTGFASLVDLRTGRIVWFNRLARPTGDLRTAKPATDTVADLLAGLPL
jgi:hypothetical protein